MFSILSQLHTSWTLSQENAAPMRPSILGKQGTCVEQVIGYRFNNDSKAGFKEACEGF